MRDWVVMELYLMQRYHFFVNDPLVAMIGIGDYGDGLTDLVGVPFDYNNLLNLFYFKWGYSIMYKNDKNETVYQSNQEFGNEKSDNGFELKCKLRWYENEITEFALSVRNKIVECHKYQSCFSLTFVVQKYTQKMAQ